MKPNNANILAVPFIAGTTYHTGDNANGVPIWTTEVAFCNVPAVQRIIERDYTKKAVVSMNEIFTCYSTREDDGFCYTRLDDNPRSGGTIPPRFSGEARYDVQAYDIRSGLNVGICPTFGSQLQTGMQAVHDKEDAQDIRGIALRAPLMIAGFGYSTEGLPVPSKYEDIVGASGIEFYYDEIDLKKSLYAATPNQHNLDFVLKAEARKEYDRRTFARNVRQRQDIWKTAPLDLRYDGYNKMWVAAPNMFGGYATSDIPASSGRYSPSHFTSGTIALIMNRYETGKAEEPYEKLLIINRSATMDIPSGAWVIATRSNNGEYWPIHADCFPDNSGVY